MTKKGRRPYKQKHNLVSAYSNIKAGKKMEDLKIRPVHSSYNLREMLFFNYSVQKYVDTLIIGNNGSVKAHSTIISEKNEVFKNLLTAQEHKEEKVINLPQFSLEVIKVILEYMYRGDARYFKEIETDVKSAIKYFFDPPKFLSDSDDCIEVKPIVPVVILTDSDNEELNSSDPSRSSIRQTKYGINKKRAGTRKSPNPRKLLARTDQDLSKNGDISDNKKNILQSEAVSESNPSQTRFNEHSLKFSPLKHLSEISVSKRVLSENTKKEQRKRQRETEEEPLLTKRNVFNPFASKRTKSTTNSSTNKGDDLTEELSKSKKSGTGHSSREPTAAKNHKANTSALRILGNTILNNPLGQLLKSSTEAPTTTADNTSELYSTTDTPIPRSPHKEKLECLTEDASENTSEVYYSTVTQIPHSPHKETLECLPEDASENTSEVYYTTDTPIPRSTDKEMLERLPEDASEKTSEPYYTIDTPIPRVLNKETLECLPAMEDASEITILLPNSPHKDPSIPASKATTKSSTSKDPTSTSPVVEDKEFNKQKPTYLSTDDEDDSLINSPPKVRNKKFPTQSKKSVQSDNTKPRKKENPVEEECVTKLLKGPIRLQQNICVLCMKEFNDILMHLKKHKSPNPNSASKCKKCTHKFLYKYYKKKHLEVCTGTCKCIICKP